MKRIKTINKNLNRFIDINFLLKLLFITAGLYCFNIFYIGIVDPKGLVYSSFLANYLDYISWLRSSILHASNFIAHCFGLRSYISDIYTLKVLNGSSVIIGFTCLGYGIMSFWIGFIMAHKNNLQEKLFWCLIGIVSVWFINCCRIAFLLYALQNHWKALSYIDHHTMFNIVAYSLIILLIVIFDRDNKKRIYINLS